MYLVYTVLASAQNIVRRAGIGTPSLRPGFPQGKFQDHELPEAKRRAKLMVLMSTPNGVTQEFYVDVTVVFSGMAQSSFGVLNKSLVHML